MRENVYLISWIEYWLIMARSNDEWRHDYMDMLAMLFVEAGVKT